MGSPVIKHGGIYSSSTETICPLEFKPASSTSWKSTMVAAFPVLAQPNTVGGAGPAGGGGQNLGTARLQLNYVDCCEFRMLETYYAVAGGAVLVIPWNGISFTAGSSLRWLFDNVNGSGMRAAATFFGED